MVMVRSPIRGHESRGQSKPIERAWRDFCDTIAKHPVFAGAYTGNKPDAKPENYGSHAVPLALFRAVFAREIAGPNAGQGRRTEIAGSEERRVGKAGVWKC